MTRPYEVKGYSERGAQMGRREHRRPEEIEGPVIFEVTRVPLDAGGYDPGGAYWGANIDGEIGHLWWYTTENGEVSEYIRAKDITDATNQIEAQFPGSGYCRPNNGEIDPHQLDEFTTAYIKCALWSSHCNEEEDGDSGGPMMDDRYSVDEISQECLKEMVQDCLDFRDSAQWLAVSKLTDRPDDSCAGHDFWLNRNGHGSGFWDGHWPDPHGDALSKWSKTFGAVDLYVGDDHKIHGT